MKTRAKIEVYVELEHPADVTPDEALDEYIANVDYMLDYEGSLVCTIKTELVAGKVRDDD